MYWLALSDEKQTDVGCKGSAFALLELYGFFYSTVSQPDPEFRSKTLAHPLRRA